MATQYYNIYPRICLYFWWIDDRWTLICFTWKNCFPLLPKLNIFSLSSFWQTCPLLTLCYHQWLVYDIPQPQPWHYHTSVTGKEWHQARLHVPHCGCFLGMPLALDSRFTSKAQRPLGISKFLFFEEWKGGYCLELCSYFIWSMWCESSSGYFLATEWRSKNRYIWCCTSL